MYLDVLAKVQKVPSVILHFLFAVNYLLKMGQKEVKESWGR